MTTLAATLLEAHGLAMADSLGAGTCLLIIRVAFGRALAGQWWCPLQ
jgi:hypothetical protein